LAGLLGIACNAFPNLLFTVGSFALPLFAQRDYLDIEQAVRLLTDLQLHIAWFLLDLKTELPYIGVIGLDLIVVFRVVDLPGPSKKNCSLALDPLIRPLLRERMDGLRETRRTSKSDDEKKSQYTNAAFA
jgi:hypothetical protein